LKKRNENRFRGLLQLTHPTIVAVGANNPKLPTSGITRLLFSNLFNRLIRIQNGPRRMVVRHIFWYICP
jgi:hypothetical protein